MPKITKLCLHLLKFCRKNCGLFFSGHGVVRKSNQEKFSAFGATGEVRKFKVELQNSTTKISVIASMSDCTEGLVTAVQALQLFVLVIR